MNITFSQALEGYELAAHARRLSPRTLCDYWNTFNKFQAHLNSDPPIAEITAGRIRSFLAAHDTLSAKTILNYHTALSALWRWALDEKLVDRNIVRDVHPPRPEKREIEPYTQSDVRLMLQATGRSLPYKRSRDHSPTSHSISSILILRNRAIILLLLDTGIRASELCDLRVRDADLRNRKVKIFGKGAKERILPLSANTGRALWRYLTTRPEADKLPGRPLITTQDGRPLTRSRLYHLIELLGRRAGINGANVHRFRHTFAIQFLRNRGNPYALQMSLGHSTMEMTRRYLALVQADLDVTHQLASPVANWGL